MGEEIFGLAWSTATGIVLLSGVGNLLAFAVKEFISGVKRKEGEIQAISKNLPEVLAQLQATTDTVKRIEAQHSGALWLEQQRWPLKREVYELLIEHIRSVIWFCHQVHRMALTHKGPEVVDHRQAQDVEGTMQWMANIGDVGEIRTTAVTLGMHDAVAILGDVAAALQSVSVSDPRTLEQAQPLLADCYRRMLSAAQDDLSSLAKRSPQLALERRPGDAS